MWARVVLLFVLGSLPAFFLFGEIRRNAVNVPFMDDWQFIPLLEKASQGQLTFGDLWAPHDEHRLLDSKDRHHRLDVRLQGRLPHAVLY